MLNSRRSMAVVCKHRRGGVLALAALLAVNLALAACGSGSGDGKASSSDGMIHLKVRISSNTEGYDAPEIYAKKLGYFKDEGLDVDIRPGTGGAGTSQLIATGESDIAFTDLATMASGSIKGLPLMAIGAIFQSTPIATIFIPGKGISAPADLKGKLIGETATSSSYRYFPAYLSAVGLDVSDVKRVTSGIGGLPQALASGKVDAFNSYGIEEIPKMEEVYGIKVDSFPWGEKLKMLGYGIFVRPEMVKKDPDVLRKFLSAYVKGYVAAVKDPAAAAHSVIEAFPRGGGGSAKVLQRQWELAQKLQYSDSTEGRPLLWMSPSSWEGTLATLAKYADTPTDRPISDFYTNDLLPDVQKPSS